MGRNVSITYSAPGKVHLLGEHSVVYGKPALLTSIGLRVYSTVSSSTDTLGQLENSVKKIVEPIIKKHFKLKSIPTYSLKIRSELPIGSGLGSSAAISASYITSLLTYLKIKWDLNLINELTFKAEKVFHGNPSGADNAAVIYGGLIWYRKETDNLKFIQKLPLSIPAKLAKNFLLINTGTPKETTKTMVNMVSRLYQKNPRVVDKFLQKQEQLTKEVLESLAQKNEKKLKNCIKMGENNLESIGVVSNIVTPLIRQIESSYGVGKICGAGGKKGPTGVLLCYHPNPKLIEKIAKSYNLNYYKTTLGTEGLRKEK